MIKVFIIECDRCRKKIDALVAPYYVVNENIYFKHLCAKCYEVTEGKE